MKKLLQKFSLLIAALMTVVIIRAQVPVAHYSFSGNVQDNSVFNNNLSLNGTKMVADAFGIARNAISFNGVQDAAFASSADQLNTPTTTISFWINMAELPGQGEVYLISYGGWQERYKVSVPSHGKPIWTTNSTDGISDMDSGDGNEIVPGVWTHLAMSHDGATDKIYINGALVAEKAVTGDLSSTDASFGIGYDAVENANYYKGVMDEVMVFGEALSDAEIAALYELQSTAPEFNPGVVASYKFDGNAADDSAFKNHASVSNTTFITDRFGYGNSAIAMDGTSEITAANSAALNSETVTVAFWVNMDNLPGTGEYFLMSNGGWQERWKISLPSHGKPVWTTNHTGGISDMDSGDGNSLVPGVWTHVAMVHDGVKDLIYMDGELVAEKEVVGTLNATQYPLAIGYNNIDNGNFTEGSFDDVLIFNYALSAAEIEAAYILQSTFPGDDVELVADYHLNGNGIDATQFGNDAHAVDNITSVPNRHGWAGNATEGAMVADNSPVLQSENTSVSVWVKPYSFPGTGEVFILSNGGWQERWKVSLPSHGKPVFTTKATACCSDMDTGTPLELDQWSHLVFTHDAGMDYIYLNGALVNSKESAGPLSTTTYPLGIGFDPIENGGFFDGAIDDLKIFNRGLTEQEVSDLYDLESAAPQVDDELVAYYPFDGNSYDATPYNNNASTAIFGTDRFGKGNNAAIFTGSNSVTAGNSPQLNSPQATVSFWANPQMYPASGEVYLISLGGWQERFKASLPSSGKVVWTTNHENGISDMDSGDGNELPENEWTHVVLVHDGNADKIYYNGALVAEKEVVGALNSTTKPLGIGYNAVDGGNEFVGGLDEVQIFNTALDDNQILALYLLQSQASEGGDTIAPTVPLDLMAMVIFNNVTLSWSPSYDDVAVTAYKVYLNGAPVTTTEETTAQFSGLVPLTSYQFGVSAVDAAGNESNITTIMAMTSTDETPDTLAPTAPGNLVASPSFNSVLLSWDASTDDTQVSGYIVYIDGVYVDSLGANTLSILIGGLEPSELYSFEVGAFDLAGNLSELSEITVSTTEPLETAEPGLVAHYSFEGNADDSTPYANHGAIGGDPVFETADHAHGGGMNIVFDGVQDSILVPNGVQLLSDFTTVSFWIRVDETNISDAEAYILDFGNWDQRWKISLPQHLKIVWTTNSKNVQFDNFISDMDSGDGNELVKGFWWYVTMVHDGERNLVYVNGIEANSKPVTGNLNATSRPLGIGNNPDNGGQYFNGALDEVKIYNRALTADEVAKLYADGTVSVVDLTLVHKYLNDVFPNPATDRLTVQHELPTNQDVLVNIYDVTGRQVARKLIPKAEVSMGQFDIDLTSYKVGTYFMNINYGGKNLGSVTFIKQ